MSKINIGRTLVLMINFTAFLFSADTPSNNDQPRRPLKFTQSAYDQSYAQKKKEQQRFILEKEGEEQRIKEMRAQQAAKFNKQKEDEEKRKKEEADRKAQEQARKKQ